MRRLVLVFVTLVALTAAGCTGNGNTSAGRETPAGGPPGGSGTTAATGEPSHTDPAPPRCVDLTEGASFTVRMRGNQFVPSCFTASASQRLTLVNEDPSLHSFTILGTEVDIDLSGGETRELDAVEGHVIPGTYELICRYHQPDMAGEVTIVD